MLSIWGLKSNLGEFELDFPFLGKKGAFEHQKMYLWRGLRIG